MRIARYISTILHQKGPMVRAVDILTFLEDLEKENSIHVVQTKIRLMKEHLK